MGICRWIRAEKICSGVDKSETIAFVDETFDLLLPKAKYAPNSFVEKKTNLNRVYLIFRWISSFSS